ncbi:MAG: hypothetical protein QOC98_2259 [Frankiaceae bacterium]|jgi:transposase-like protein|nr:hypothetical protein [Frankiaceae bacterium]
MRVVTGTGADVVRALDTGEIACDCGRGSLRRWGWARPRFLRVGDRRVWLRPRRGRCSGCGRTHVLLPNLCLARRLDSVDVIGAALAAAAQRRGTRRIASVLGVPTSTVRDWLRAHRLRGSPLPPADEPSEYRWRRMSAATHGLLLAPVPGTSESQLTSQKQSVSAQHQPASAHG